MSQWPVPTVSPGSSDLWVRLGGRIIPVDWICFLHDRVLAIDTETGEDELPRHLLEFRGATARRLAVSPSSRGCGGMSQCHYYVPRAPKGARYVAVLDMVEGAVSASRQDDGEACRGSAAAKYTGSEIAVCATTRHDVVIDAPGPVDPSTVGPHGEHAPLAMTLWAHGMRVRPEVFAGELTTMSADATDATYTAAHGARRMKLELRTGSRRGGTLTLPDGKRETCIAWGAIP